MAREGTAVFGEAVAMVADALGVELDEIVCESEFAQTTEDVEMASWTIPAGCVAGVAASWQGRVGERTVIDLNVRWKKGPTLDPDWVIERDGWVITVEGLPTVTATLDFLPPPDFEAETIEDFMVIGHIITARPGAQRDPRGRRRATRHRHLPGPPLPDAARLGAYAQPLNGTCPSRRSGTRGTSSRCRPGSPRRGRDRGLRVHLRTSRCRS